MFGAEENTCPEKTMGNADIYTAVSALAHLQHRTLQRD